MNIKLVAASAAILVVSSAQAHFKFTLAYGDASFAAMNNSSVGGQMANGSTVKVPLSGQSFRAQIWAEKIALSDGDLYVAAGAMVAYDSAPYRNSLYSYTTSTNFLHKKVISKTSLPSGSLSNYASGFEIYDNSGASAGTGSFFALDKKFRGVFTNSNVSPRLAGLSTQFAIEPGRNIRLMVGDRMRLFDVDLTSQMSLGQTYGFASGEAGLQTFVYGGSSGIPNGGSSSFFAPISTGNEVGMRVNLLAVPEPGSGAVLALGSIILLRRRKRGSQNSGG